MFIIKLWNYIRGYVIIKINGEYGERLLNQAALENLYIWDIKRVEKDTLIARISIKDFFRLSRLVRKTRCRVYIIERVGLFFILHKIKKRKVFLAGAVLFVAITYVLASFIWSIEINSADEKLNAAIRSDLRQWGLREGVFKHSLDKDQYLDKILSKYDDIAWAEMEIRGSKIIVELVKKELPPELEQNTPCDIIASKDGIIEEIIPLRGEAVVKPGDTVSAGDILITGRISFDDENLSPEDNSSTTRELLVHAQGIVKARVWYQKAVKVPLIKEDKIPTGRTKRVYSLQIGENSINIPWGTTPFNLYEVKTIKQIKIFPEFMGGMNFSKLKVEELEQTKLFLGVDGAAQEAEKLLLTELDSFVDKDKITQKKMEFAIDDDEKFVIGSLIIEVIEDISQQQETY